MDLVTTPMRLFPGEPEGTGWRTVPLADVATLLLGPAMDAPPRTSPRIIGIDGHGGAGKTVLAERLRHRIPNSAVVHTDDVAWHHGFFNWGGLLRDHILEPLRRGEAVDWRPQAWVDRERGGSIAVPAGLEAVIVEGTGVIRRELDAVIDASLYLQGDADEQARRLAERDGDTPEERAFMAAWWAEEEPFMARERPWQHATLLVNGTARTDDDHVVVDDPVPGVR